MTVFELIGELSHQSPNAEVVVMLPDSTACTFSVSGMTKRCLLEADIDIEGLAAIVEEAN